MSTGALIAGCCETFPASHDTASSQHSGDGTRAAAMSCGGNTKAMRSIALSKAGDLVRTVSEGGAAQDSGGQWMCGAVFV